MTDDVMISLVDTPFYLGVTMTVRVYTLCRMEINENKFPFAHFYIIMYCYLLMNFSGVINDVNEIYK